MYIMDSENKRILLEEKIIDTKKIAEMKQDIINIEKKTYILSRYITKWIKTCSVLL